MPRFYEGDSAFELDKLCYRIMLINNNYTFMVMGDWVHLQSYVCEKDMYSVKMGD